VPYLLFLASFPYAFDSLDAGKYLIRTSIILVLPILIALGAPEAGRFKNQVISFYIYGLLISCVLTIVFGLFYFLQDWDIGRLQYYDLAEYMHLHPSYYSLYLLVGLALLLNTDVIKYKYKVLAFVLFTLMIVLLQSRMAYGILILLFLLRLKDLEKIKSYFWVTGVSIALAALIFVVPDSYKRIKETLIPSVAHSDLIGNELENGVTQRLWLWQNAIRQVSERPIFGYGLRSQKKVYKWKIQKENLSSEHGRSYNLAAMTIGSLNLHNQYLQILYDTGVLGLLIFIGSILLAFRRAVSRRNKLFILVYSIFLMFLFTENLLDRQMGIYFYGFILPILYLWDK